MVEENILKYEIWALNALKHGVRGADCDYDELKALLDLFTK